MVPGSGTGMEGHRSEVKLPNILENRYSSKNLCTVFIAALVTVLKDGGNPTDERDKQNGVLLSHKRE